MNESTCLTFDEQAFSVVALQKAAYRGMNFFTVDIQTNNRLHHCTLIANSEVDSEDFRKAIEEFRKDALDYQLREKISTETEPLRNLILGVAFSRTGLQGNE